VRRNELKRTKSTLREGISEVSYMTPQGIDSLWRLLGFIQERGCVFMLKDMNREISKASAVTGASILASDLLYGFDSLRAVNIPEGEKITITSIIDNYLITRPSYEIANRSSGNLYAEHCLAILKPEDGRSHCLLFDFGRLSTGLVNIDTLKIDSAAEALALSHGHLDHCGGLVEILKSRREKLSKGIPLYVGEEAFAERGQGERVVHRPPKKEEIESLGIVKIVEIIDPTPARRYLTEELKR
jgi:hypothetical protein